MPKIDWKNLPANVRQHLYDRAAERLIPAAGLAELQQWIASEPDLPDGEWVKDFGSFQLVGEGRYPKTFLLPGQAARGQSFD